MTLKCVLLPVALLWEIFSTMKNKSGRKSSDGIKRLTKTTRTSSSPRSFNDALPTKKLSLEKKNRAVKKRRSASIATRKKKQKPITPVLGDFSREKIPELTLKKSYYTPPTTKMSSGFLNQCRKFITRNKKIVNFLVKALTVFLVLFVLLNQNPKTHGFITHHIEYQAIDEIINLKKNPKEDELGFDLIAISDEESVSVIAEGKKAVETKSSGEITIFNNFSSEPQKLLPNTRFESASGKIFLLGDNEIIIPGKTGTGPGKIDTTVYAGSAGEEYNIGITDFTVPGYKELGLDEKYNTIYAVSKNTFEGGYVGVESVVTQDQQEAVEKELQSKLQERLILKLQKEKTDQVFLLQNTASIQYKEPEAIFDNEGNAGVISQRGTIIAAVISKDQLEEYINQNLVVVPENESARVININDLTMNYDGFNTIDYDNLNSIKISLTGEVLLQWDINYEILSYDLKGKTKQEVLDFFESTNTVDAVVLKTRPFWKNKLPRSEKNISFTQQ